MSIGTSMPAQFTKSCSGLGFDGLQQAHEQARGQSSERHTLMTTPRFATASPRANPLRGSSATCATGSIIYSRFNSISAASSACTSARLKIDFMEFSVRVLLSAMRSMQKTKLRRNPYGSLLELLTRWCDQSTFTSFLERCLCRRVLLVQVGQRNLHQVA